MGKQVIRTVSSVNRAPIALALHIMEEEAFKVEGVRSGVYDGDSIVVDEEAFVMATLALYEITSRILKAKSRMD